MKELKDKMIYASFIGDALSLGVHWIYSGSEIVKKHGKIMDYIDPSGSKYHSNKNKGDQTHYGDQMMVLLESIAEEKGFDSKKFSEKWQDLFKDYKGYFDGATKNTLNNLKNGELFLEAGSTSNDLAGAARIAPIVYRYFDDENLLLRYAEEQTALTHKDPQVIESAKFFASVTALVLKGEHPVEALEKTSRDKFSGSVIAEWVKKGIKGAAKDSMEALEDYGLTCHIPDAFPGVIQVIAKYHNNLVSAFSECISAGGDNAARSIVVGMILGASEGSGDLPEKWLNGLAYRDKIKTLIGRM